MNSYTTMKKKHQEEVNAFPMFFAFSKEQLYEGMEKLGLDKKDTDKLGSIGAGGYIRKADKESFKAMFARHEEERQAAIQADSTGDGFIFDMFLCELDDHEYGYIGDIEDTLNALGITEEDFVNNPRLVHGLEAAATAIDSRRY